MKLLILGEGSQLGAALVDLCGHNDDLECRAVGITALQPPFAHLTQLITNFEPDFVLNAHTMATAESRGVLDESHLRFVRFLAEFAASSGFGLVHLSSAQVFSQSKGKRYREADDVQPDTEVGWKFLQIEQMLTKSCSRLVILRCSWVFGLEGHGALHEFLELLALGGGEAPLYLEEEGAPTSAADLSRVVLAMVRQLHWGADCWGVYHYCSSDVASSREFAETVMVLAGQHGNVDISAVKLIEEYEPDSRGVPHHPVMDCARIKDCFGIKQRPWRSTMTTTIKNYYQQAAKDLPNGQV